MFARPVWSFHDVAVVGFDEQSAITVLQTVRVVSLEVGISIRWAKEDANLSSGHTIFESLRSAQGSSIRQP